MVLVTTPTGKSGSLIVQQLLNENVEVQVLARKPENIPLNIRSKISIVQGSLLNKSDLKRAMRGCDSMYYCIPESNEAHDMVKRYEGFAFKASEAIKNSSIERVVFLSGAGKNSHLKSPVSTALHNAEDILTHSGKSLKALRCPVFYESLLYQIEPIHQIGMFFLPFDGDFKAPQVAVNDIAAEAVKWLSDKNWSGVSGVSIISADSISYNEISQTLSELLNKPIRFQQVTVERYIQTLLGIGSTPSFADSLVKMYDAIQEGMFKDDLNIKQTTQGIPFREWANTVFLKHYEVLGVQENTTF